MCEEADDDVLWEEVLVGDDDDGARALERFAHGGFVDQQDRVVLVAGARNNGDKIADISKFELVNTDKSGKINARIVKDDRKCVKFAFASAYCEEEGVFFMHGGFNSDSTCFLTSSGSLEEWRCVGPSRPRGGFISAAYVKSKSKPNYVYTFGGQSVDGFNYNNDVHRFDLTSLCWTKVNCKGKGPSPRSQSISFVFDDCLFVFGGCDGQSIRNDLFSLDLDDHEWTEVETSGVERPQAIVRLAQTNFHFCKPAGILLGRRFLLVSEDPAAQTFVVFVLHLKRLEWRRLKGRKSAGNPRIFDPPAKVGASLTITSDGRLILAGGKPRQPRHGPTVWQLLIPRCLSWSQERLLWLATFKNSSECHLAKCPPNIIYKIIGIVNANKFYIKEATPRL